VNATVPAALAVAGTALMAVALFGPFRRSVDVDDAVETGTRKNGGVLWPALVDASAVSCDISTRIDIADALGALRTAWSETILRKAYEVEPEPAVRDAIATALRETRDNPLSPSRSLVT
jgi:hypothetical protein